MIINPEYSSISASGRIGTIKKKITFPFVDQEVTCLISFNYYDSARSQLCIKIWNVFVCLFFVFSRNWWKWSFSFVWCYSSGVYSVMVRLLDLVSLLAEVVLWTLNDIGKIDMHSRLYFAVCFDHRCSIMAKVDLGPVA